MNTPKYTVTLAKKRDLTHDVQEFTFDKPDTLDFNAGQFLQFFIPHEGEMLPRAYSICSSPQDNYLRFCIKILPDGKASTFFDNMPVGESIEISDPNGHFYNNKKQPLSLVATGSGIAPMMGIVKDELIYKKNTDEIRLLFGVRHEKDMFWQEEFDSLALEYPNFSYNMVLSRPEESWQGLKGYVTDHIEKHTDDHNFFLCGSKEMVIDVRKRLLTDGVDGKLIHFEIF
jgi:CDP-4-dehydro-6-deoxyglucose reductase, E3